MVCKWPFKIQIICPLGMPVFKCIYSVISSPSQNFVRHRTYLNMLLWAFFFPFVLFSFKKWILWRSWPHVNAGFTRIRDQQGCCAAIQKLSTSCGFAAHSLLLCRRHQYSSKGMLNLAAVLYLSLGMGWRRLAVI